MTTAVEYWNAHKSYFAHFERLARADADHSEDGMIALVPRDPQQWAIPGGEPPEEFHVTLQYISDINRFDPTMVKSKLDAISAQFAPIEARVMGHATFNPDGGPTGDMDPCAVYLISDSPELAELAAVVQSEFPDPDAHQPYLCHMTAGYGFKAEQLSVVGPVLFDRIRLALGEQVTEFAL